jgi:predicted O-methyltransferase YrrM
MKTTRATAIYNTLTDIFNLLLFKKIILRYLNKRSYTYSSGKLPIVDIFEYVPEADQLDVKISAIFESQLFSNNFPLESVHYTSSTSLSDSVILALIAIKSKAKKILEIGTSFGETALLFAINTDSDAEIITLDIQKNNPTIGVKFKNSKYAKKITQKFDSLINVYKEFHEKSFDIIFIDGDHTYEGCLQDSIIAIKLIRPGGYICWHDYSFSCRNGVVKAIDELFEKNSYKITKIAYCNVTILQAPL